MERVDYLLLSPGLTPSLQAGSAQIYDGPAATAGSDHRILVITLNFGDVDPKN
jgi:hypothetical protein